MLIKKVSVEDERRRSTALLDSVAAVSKQEPQVNNRATKKWQLLPELDTESACSFSSPPNESDWEDDFEQDDSSCTKIKSQDSLQGKRYYYFEDVPSSSARRAADSHLDDNIPQSDPRTSSSSWMKMGAFVVIGAVGLYAAFTLGERMGEKKAAQASFWRVRDVETLLFAW